jgi:hypothetical protein
LKKLTIEIISQHEELMEENRILKVDQTSAILDEKYVKFEKL